MAEVEREREIIIIPVATLYFCIKMGSDESHFNVS